MINPKLMRPSVRGEYFSNMQFWRWIVYGIFQSIIVYYIGFITFNWTPNPSTGKIGDIWLTGTFIYAAIVIFSNTRVLFDSYSHTPWSIIILLLSVLSFFFFFWLENLWKANELFGLFSQIHSMPIYYANLFICFFVTFPIDMYLHYLERQRKEDQHQELKRLKKEEKERFTKDLDASRLAPLHRCKLPFS